MDLKTYLTKYKINIVNFAVYAGVSPGVIVRCLKGGNPRQKTAEAIEKASDGLVTIMELRGKDRQLKRENQKKTEVTVKLSEGLAKEMELQDEDKRLTRQNLEVFMESLKGKIRTALNLLEEAWAASDLDTAEKIINTACAILQEGLEKGRLKEGSAVPE